MSVRRFFTRLWRNRVGFIGFVIAAIVVLAALTGP